MTLSICSSLDWRSRLSKCPLGCTWIWSCTGQQQTRWCSREEGDFRDRMNKFLSSPSACHCKRIVRRSALWSTRRAVSLPSFSSSTLHKSYRRRISGSSFSLSGSFSDCHRVDNLNSVHLTEHQSQTRIESSAYLCSLCWSSLSEAACLALCYTLATQHLLFALDSSTVWWLSRSIRRDDKFPVNARISPNCTHCTLLSPFQQALLSTCQVSNRCAPCYR